MYPGEICEYHARTRLTMANVATQLFNFFCNIQHLSLIIPQTGSSKPILKKTEGRSPPKSYQMVDLCQLKLRNSCNLCHGNHCVSFPILSLMVLNLVSVLPTFLVVQFSPQNSCERFFFPKELLPNSIFRFIYTTFPTSFTSPTSSTSTSST